VILDDLVPNSRVFGSEGFVVMQLWIKEISTFLFGKLCLGQQVATTHKTAGAKSLEVVVAASGFFCGSGHDVEQSKRKFVNESFPFLRRSKLQKNPNEQHLKLANCRKRLTPWLLFVPLKL